jgi:hypothetical protein
VLLHVVRVLASLNGRSFSLIYIHGGADSSNDAPHSWLKQLYGLLDYPHASQLSACWPVLCVRAHERSCADALYVVHPTFFVKVYFGLMAPFVSSSFNEKLRVRRAARARVDVCDPRACVTHSQYLPGLSELFAIFPRASLQLPDDVLRFDSLITGHRWDDKASNAGGI